MIIYILGSEKNSLYDEIMASAMLVESQLENLVTTMIGSR